MVILARSQYDDRPVLESDLSFVGDKGLTKQSDSRDCDINAMFKRFEKSGQLPNMIVRDGRYGDFSNVPDYQSAIGIVRHAHEQFEALDATIRNRFDNDPAKFLAFATDPKNTEEMEKLGLLNEQAMKRLADKRKAEKEAAIAARQTELSQAENDLIAKVKAAIKADPA